MSDEVDPKVAAYRLLIADVTELVGRSRATSEVMARAVGHTVARWHLMSVLSDGPRSVASAARRLGLARQSVQRVANELLAERLVVARPDPADGRAPRFELTARGRHAVDELYRRSELDRADLVEAAGIGADELLAARRTVQALLAQFEAREGSGER